MGYCYCTPKCKKWTTFGVSAAFLLFGIFFAVFWGMIMNTILNYELSLSSTETKSYGMWKETPIPMHLSFYLFNWTNADEAQEDPSIKPHFTECGPYTYYEHHIKDNVTFNDNSTVSFYNRRIWKYAPELSVGSLSDKITTFNPVVAVIANIIKDKNYLVKIGLNFFLEEKKVKLAVTKTVDEFIFKGYDDPLLTLAKKLDINGFKIPFEKFGWFVDRNNSVEYDGFYNMDDGVDSLNTLGIVRNWNYANKVPYYDGDCGKIQGTQGELWYPPHEQDSIKLFSNDLCSSLELEKSGTFSLHGIEGYKYIGTKKTLDNGTLYPEMACFVGKDVTQQLSGVRNVSLCKFRAPAFVSYPHFYEADPAYLEAIDGLEPNRTLHEMYLALEPSTGVPMSVKAQIQLNLQLENVEHITILSNMEPRLMPMFWFSQTTELTEDLASSIKILLTLPSVGQYTGYGMLGLGALILLIGSIITYKKGWHDSDEEQLLDQNAL